MKLRKYLVRTTVGATAFLFSLGIFTTWQYARTAPSVLDRNEQAVNSENSTPVAFKSIIELPNPLTTEKPVETKDEPEKIESEFDAEGYYYIYGEKTPKGFEDFQNFNVTNKNYKTENEDDYGKLIAPEGYVQAKNELNFNKISIGNNQIRFETERVKGINYSFAGEFTETRSFIYLEPEETEKVLKGVLIKKRNGKKIAEAEAVFGWFAELGCGC